MAERSWYWWPWHCPSYRPIQGFWWYQSSITLIAKLNAYAHDVNTNSLYFLASYLEKRKPREKVIDSYSNIDDIFSGVLQGSMLGLLLFKRYISNLFFSIRDLDIASYAADNAPYTFSSELDMILKKLSSYTIKLFKWFHKNHLKQNAGNTAQQMKFSIKDFFSKCD